MSSILVNFILIRTGAMVFKHWWTLLQIDNQLIIWTLSWIYENVNWVSCPIIKNCIYKWFPLSHFETLINFLALLKNLITLLTIILSALVAFRNFVLALHVLNNTSGLLIPSTMLRCSTALQKSLLSILSSSVNWYFVNFIHSLFDIISLIL